MSSSGVPSDGGSGFPSLSGDGRYLAFESGATNLAPGDTNAQWDVFVRDIAQGVTTRVSVSGTGVQANAISSMPSISADGRYIAFASDATNLVPFDTNNQRDIFVHDRQTHATTRVSVDSGGNERNGGWSVLPSISATGRYVAFESDFSSLVPLDTDKSRDVFVHDRNTGITTRVSVDSMGNAIGGTAPSLSADGRYVAFVTYFRLVPDGIRSGVFVHDRNTATTTLVSIDNNGNSLNGDSFHPSISADGRYVTFDTWLYSLNREDIFVHDRDTAKTTRVSVNSAGTQANAQSDRPHISGDGRYVTFTSAATNLVQDDTNGKWDLFIHDRTTAKTRSASLDAQGVQANGNSDEEQAISNDGRYVAIISPATNLVPNDLNGKSDVFVRAVPNPVIDSITPNKLPVGATTPIVIRGSDFLRRISISVEGATLSKVIVWNENVISADATVPANQSAGAHNVAAALLGTGAGAMTGSSAQCVNCVTMF